MKKDNFQRSSLAASEVVLKLSGCMMSSNACLQQTTDDLLVREGDVQCPSVVEGSWRGGSVRLCQQLDKVTGTRHLRREVLSRIREVRGQPNGIL